MDQVTSKVAAAPGDDPCLAAGQEPWSTGWLSLTKHCWCATCGGGWYSHLDRVAAYFKHAASYRRYCNKMNRTQPYTKRQKSYVSRRRGSGSK